MGPVERRRDFEGHLEMVDRLLWLTLGSIYLAENMMRSAGVELIAFLRE